MDSRDNKMAAASTGNEGHGVYLCHRCGWPFPNPHPSARHRRAHKKVCGTIEGYKIIHSEEHDSNLPVSDDEHASDEEEHTPNPKLVKKNSEEFGSSRGVGEKSNRSEDDVFSDAVTEFSDSGISPRLEERFESALDKSIEQKSLEAHLNGAELVNVDTIANATEDRDDPTRNEEMSNLGTLVNANNQSGATIPITDAIAESELLRDVAVDNISEYGNGLSVGQMKDRSASVTLQSEGGRISDPALSADESKDEFCDKLVCEVVKHDLPQTGTLQNLDASAGVANGSLNTVGESSLSEETHENSDASVGVKESFHSNKDIGTIGADAENILVEGSLLSKPGGSMLTSVVATEQFEVKHVVSSIDIEFQSKNSLAAGEKCDVGANENRHPEESKDNFSVDAASDIAFACVGDDDQNTRAFEKDGYHSEAKSTSKISGTRNEKGEGASEEVQVMVDTTMPSNDSSDLPSSCEAATDEADLHKSSKAESSSPRDNVFDKPFEGLSEGNVAEAHQSVVSDDVNNNFGDVSDRKYSPASTLEDPVSPVITEPPKHIHVTELKDNNEAVASEGTPEQQISKECISLITASELLSKNYADGGNADIISEGDAGASEIIDGHDENLENTNPKEQEALLVKTKCSTEMSSPDVDYVSSSKAAGDVIISEKCDTPSLKETVPSPLDVRKSPNETSAANSVINVDDVVTSGVDSKSLQAEVDVEKLTSHKVGVTAVNDLTASNNSSSRSDSVEGNCGSVSETSKTDSQKLTTEVAQTHPDKSDTFEPPSFMTLVQSGGDAVTEIENVNNNQQQPKHDNALQAWWFPSITNVSNESEGRKKNEQIISKVTNSGPAKQHGSLKNLLNDIKSPNTKQVKKDESHEPKDDGAVVVVSKKDEEKTNKNIEQWNSPARYPIEIIKKEKKKKSFWVPFVCCSSVHRDL